jgi:transposase-like protein
MSKAYDESTKRKIMTELSQSGLSISAFSKRRGIAESTLWKWRKAAERAEGSSFIELGGSVEQYEISSKGVVLKIPGSAPAEKITEIFKALTC